MNVLEVDPQNLKFDFEPAWTSFQTTKVCKFLRLYLEMRISNGRTRLEKTSPEETGQAQGAVQEARQILTVLEKAFATEQMTEVIKYLETNYGK